jgi:hypothetical protein
MSRLIQGRPADTRTPAGGAPPARALRDTYLPRRWYSAIAARTCAADHTPPRGAEIQRSFSSFAIERSEFAPAVRMSSTTSAGSAARDLAVSDSARRAFAHQSSEEIVGRSLRARTGRSQVIKGAPTVFGLAVAIKVPMGSCRVVIRDVANNADIFRALRSHEGRGRTCLEERG